MKNRGLLIAMLLLPYLAFVQNGNPADEFELQWGDPYTLPKKFFDYGYTGSMNEGILQICVNSKNDVLIQRFNTDKLSATGSLSIDISEKPGNFVPDLFSFIGNDLYMFYSTWDKETEREHLYADKINLETGNFDGDPVQLIEARKIAGSLITTGLYKFSTANKYKFAQSIDSSKLLVTYVKFTESPNSKEMMGFQVFDKNLELVWGQEFRMPYTPRMMEKVDYAVDSKGVAYLLCKVYETKATEKSGGSPNYHYEVLKMDKGYETLKQIKIELDEKFINSLFITQGVTGEMICAGFYRTVFKSSNKEPLIRQNNSDGVFMVKIGENDALIFIKKGYYEWPAELIKEFEKTSAQNKIDQKEDDDLAEAPDLLLRKVLLADDGSYIIIGEQFTIDIKQKAKYLVERYTYGDIYVMKISEQGEIAWTHKIPKYQQGYNNPGGLSFKHFWYNSNNYFIYLDNLKNLNLSPDMPAYKHVDGQGGFLTVCKLDNEGKMTKGNIFDTKEEELYMCPTDFWKIGKEVMVCSVGIDNGAKLLKIEYKNDLPLK